MTGDDLFDSYDDFDGDGERIDEPAEVVCNRCGEIDLHWVEGPAPGGSRVLVWHLFDAEGNQHICHALEGFERIS